ncbi:MAG: A/G-specific adenine glycosylase [Ottowia sp.]|nr:A/G-specific adenine glycosylase [Ottowia sp.]
MPQSFADRLIAWQLRGGRHDLPWQKSRDPYRVWLSEIMLQQTQVQTVLSYYPHFLQRFPTVHALAAATEDDVLGLWSGLGYYSRARNLHAAARQIVDQHGGRFPATSAQLLGLPGVGPSTAAAIAAFCFGERSSIFDGNVKRVLSRYWGVADDLGRAAPARALRQRAQSLLPQARQMPAYTQGLMDLGALLCTPRAPQCSACPLQADCIAHARGRPEDYPMRKRPLPRPEVSLWLLHGTDAAGRVFLQRRPSRGIWASLHCLPAFASPQELEQALPLAATGAAVRHDPIAHALTHRQLSLHVRSVPVRAQRFSLADGRWFAPTEWPALGLPAPVRRFLQRQHAAASPA